MNSHQTSQWAAAMRRFDEASIALQRLEEDASVDDETIEWADDELADAERALMAMPAPDGLALSWKLDRILTPQEDGCTPSWSVNHLAQTTADYRAMLNAPMVALRA